MFEAPPDPVALPVLKSLLRTYGIRPTRAKGQSFLVNARVREQLLAAAELEPGEVVLEIGGGLGALTLPLAERARWTVVVEKDSACVEALRHLLLSSAPVDVHHADALKAPLEDWLARRAQGRPIVVVSNLPYSASKPLLQRLLGLKHPWRRMVLTLQREVAQRLMARPGEEGYGPLSLSVWARAEARLLFRIPPSAFYPKPEVESAAVALLPLPRPRVSPSEEEGFFRVVRAAFGTRRKTLLNALSQGLGWERSRVEALLRRVGLEPDQRAEQVEAEAFLELARGLEARV